MSALPAVVPLLDALLQPYVGLLGRRFPAYRNHVCRVASFHCLLAPTQGAALERLAIATAFHDLGIWTTRSLDYIEPSVALATSHLRENGREEWIGEVAAMIRHHHQVTACPLEAGQETEAFRCADWIDVSAGALRFGLPRAAVRQVRAQYPGAGFHRFLLAQSAKRMLTHPLRPLPMFRW